MRPILLACLGLTFAAGPASAETFDGARAKARDGSVYFAGAYTAVSGEVDRSSPWLVLAFGRKASGEIIARRVSGSGAQLEIRNRDGTIFQKASDNGGVEWASSATCPALANVPASVAAIPERPATVVLPNGAVIPSNTFIRGADGIGYEVWSNDPQKGRALDYEASVAWIGRTSTALVNCWSDVAPR